MKALPTLRQDLIIKEQSVRNIKSYIFKDPDKQKYYRFDEEEYFVFSRLDGEITASQIAAEYKEAFNEKITTEEITEFIGSVKDLGLFQRSEAEQNTYLYEKQKEQRKSQILQAQGSVFYFRIKFWDPDEFFKKLMRYIPWVWSRRFVLLMNLFMLSGLILLLRNFDEIKLGMVSIFDFFNQDASSLFFLWVTVMGTIMIHELGHGLTCRRFGGECREIGFLFMFMNPCMYANVNDAWLFEERKHRLYVTFAGCYAEFLLGFVSVYIWFFTQPGSMINVLTFQIVIVAFFSAIFMNFNPLMKFDGYFALSDYLEMPNLRDRSKDYVKYVISTKIFRLDREAEEATWQEKKILFTYGVLMIIYLINVMLGLGVMIGGMLISKLGTTLGVPLAIFIIYKLQWRFVTGFFGFIKVVLMEHESFFKRTRWFFRIFWAGLVTAIAGIFLFLPMNQRLEFRGTLEAVNASLIRSLAAGYVLPHQEPNKLRFHQGEVMLTLENNDLGLQLKNHLLDIEENSLKTQQAIAQGDMTALTKLRQQGAKLRETKMDLLRQQKNLVIKAPFDGILEKHLTTLENTFLEKGQEIEKLIDPTVYQSSVSILERDLEKIQVGTGAYLLLDVQPWKYYQGKVTKISVQPEEQGLVRTYQITVAFPNQKAELRSGLEGNVLLNVGRATLLQRSILWVQKTVRLDLQL